MDVLKGSLENPSPSYFLFIMNTVLTLVGAYGRDYTSKKAIINDIKANKDFQIMPTSSYINLKDIKSQDIKEVRVRFKRLMNLAYINIARDI